MIPLEGQFAALPQAGLNPSGFAAFRAEASVREGIVPFADKPSEFGDLLQARRGEFKSVNPDLSSPEEQERLEREARTSAEQLIASTLVMPLLKMARQNPLRSEMFSGGAGERTFGPQLDAAMADAVVKGSRWPVVDQITDIVMQGKKNRATPIESSANPFNQTKIDAALRKEVDLVG